jgi:hypothetical protein
MEPIQLEYATPAALRPPANALRLTSLWTCGIAAVGGVASLVLFAITASEVFPIAGFYWLGIGGLLSLTGFITAVIYTAVGRSRKWPAPSTPRRATIAVVFPFVNIGLAMACLFGGTWLMGYHNRLLYIHNMGTTPIDKVVVFSPSFSKTVGPIAPGESTSFHFPNLDEFLRMNVTASNTTVPYDVADTMIADGVTGRPRHVELIGATGYKNSHSEPLR